VPLRGGGRPAAGLLLGTQLERRGEEKHREAVVPKQKGLRHASWARRPRRGKMTRGRGGPAGAAVERNPASSSCKYRPRWWTSSREEVPSLHRPAREPHRYPWEKELQDAAHSLGGELPCDLGGGRVVPRSPIEMLPGTPERPCATRTRVSCPKGRVAGKEGGG